LASTAVHRKRRRFLALAAVAIALAVMFVGAILPTPLYPLYRQAFGFSGITLTLIYAVYVLGNVAALLFFGRLADQIGRRNTILPAIGFGIAGTLAFAFAAGTSWLFAARFLSGFSTGLAAGAAKG
jgi:MFS family permease